MREVTNAQNMYYTQAVQKTHPVCDTQKVQVVQNAQNSPEVHTMRDMNNTLSIHDVKNKQYVRNPLAFMCILCIAQIMY